MRELKLVTHVVLSPSTVTYRNWLQDNAPTAGSGTPWAPMRVSSRAQLETWALWWPSQSSATDIKVVGLLGRGTAPRVYTLWMNAVFRALFCGARASGVGNAQARYVATTTIRALSPDFQTPDDFGLLASEREHLRSQYVVLTAPQEAPAQPAPAPSSSGSSWIAPFSSHHMFDPSQLPRHYIVTSSRARFEQVRADPAYELMAVEVSRIIYVMPDRVAVDLGHLRPIDCVYFVDAHDTSMRTQGFMEVALARRCFVQGDNLSFRRCVARWSGTEAASPVQHYVLCRNRAWYNTWLQNNGYPNHAHFINSWQEQNFRGIRDGFLHLVGDWQSNNANAEMLRRAQDAGMTIVNELSNGITTVTPPTTLLVSDQNAHRNPFVTIPSQPPGYTLGDGITLSANDQPVMFRNSVSNTVVSALTADVEARIQAAILMCDTIMARSRVYTFEERVVAAHTRASLTGQTVLHHAVPSDQALGTRLVLPNGDVLLWVVDQFTHITERAEFTETVTDDLEEEMDTRDEFYEDDGDPE